MIENIGTASQSRIRILSPAAAEGADVLPLGEVPLPDGDHRLGDLGDLTHHPHLPAGATPRCEVILLQSVYKKVNDHLKEDVSREHGGFLLGYESTMGGSQTPVVVVTDAVAARFTEGSPVRLTFAMDTWRALDDEIAKRYAKFERPPQQVGWYHSHPNIRIFLSTWDLDVCTTYERRRYPLALVADPVNDRGGCFIGGSAGYDPQGPQGFYEAHDVVKGSSIVTWDNVAARASSDRRSAGAVLVAAKETPARETVSRETPSTETAGESRIKIRVPSNPKIIGSLWPVVRGAVAASALAAIGVLYYLQMKQQREIAGIQESLSRQPVVTVETHQPAAVPVPELPPAPLVTIKPAEATVASGRQFTFKVDKGTVKQNDQHWSIQPAVGSVSASGIYSAPASISEPQTILLSVNSISHPELFATAQVHLEASPAAVAAQAPVSAVTVTPARVQLEPGKSQRFKAVIGGNAKVQKAGVKWVVSPSGLGSIDKNGNYVAPHTAGANQTVSVTATSVSLPAQSGKAMVVLMPSPAGAGSVKPASAGTGSTAPSAPTAALPAPVVQPATPPAAAPSQSLKVSANKPELSDGQDATLTAHLGDSPVDVKWSISPPGVGILSPEGRYFAPQKIDSASEVTITAKKTDNPSISGQIVIKLKANLPKTSDATQ